jgi:hypothetical protein
MRKPLIVLFLSVAAAPALALGHAGEGDKTQGKQAKRPLVHAVYFYLKKDAPAGAADKLINDAHEFLKPIATVRSFWVGRPAQKPTPEAAVSDYQVGLLITFEAPEGLHTYLDHPLHLKFVERHKKNLAKVSVFDFVHDEPKTSEPRAPKPIEPLRPMGHATLRGRVLYDGESPDFTEANAALQKQMAVHPDRVHLLKADARATGQQTWIVGKKGEVANVVIWLQPPPGFFFPMPPQKKSWGFFFPMPPEKKSWPAEVILDAPGAAFVPHVLALFPVYRDSASGAMVSSGQVFKIRNSAPFASNFNWRGDPLKNPDGSLTLPKNEGAQPPMRALSFREQASPISFADDIHKWVSAKVWVFAHPYAAVTKGHRSGDDPRQWGTYEIRDVPAGVDLYLVAWHEAAAGGGFFLPEGRAGRKIHLKDGETRTIDLRVK